MVYKCKQMLRGRRCSMEIVLGDYCHKHQDQSLYARVGRKCNLSPAMAEEVATAIIDEMGWDEIKAFLAEHTGQSVFEDAGEYMKRKLGRLFGIRPKEEILTYKDMARAMLKGGNQ